VIKFISDMRQVGGILVSFTNKTEILLKVALNTINLTINNVIIVVKIKRNVTAMYGH
jgi:hypothetical protein